MFGLGATELAIILVIVIVLFGARRLPEIGSGVGKAIKNFKAGLSGNEIDVTPEREESGKKKPDELNERSATGQVSPEQQKTESS